MNIRDIDIEKIGLLSVIDSILFLANLRRLDMKPYFKKMAFVRCRRRIFREYGFNIDGPPSRLAYDLLLSCGGDIQLWPDEIPPQIKRMDS